MRRLRRLYEEKEKKPGIGRYPMGPTNMCTHQPHFIFLRAKSCPTWFGLELACTWSGARETAPLVRERMLYLVWVVGTKLYLCIWICVPRQN